MYEKFSLEVPGGNFTLFRTGSNDLRITVTDDPSESNARKTSIIINQWEELQLIKLFLESHNAKDVWHESKLELIEWNKLKLYRDEETGMLCMSNPPAEPGSVMLLLKNGSIVFDTYCVEDFIHIKSGAQCQLHYFDENGLDLDDIDAWAEIPTGYKRVENDK